MSKRAKQLLAGAALAVACVIAFAVSPANKAQARSANLIGDQFTNLAPVFTDPDRYTGSVGETPTIGIANPSVTMEGAIQRLIITNKHATNDLCVFWVATAAACGTAINCDGSGTDNGDLILGRMVKKVDVAGDLKTCVVASATNTTFHISRSKVE